MGFRRANHRHHSGKNILAGGGTWTSRIAVSSDFQANFVFLGIALKVVLSVKSRDRNERERILGWLKVRFAGLPSCAAWNHELFQGSATLLCLLGVTWVFGFLTAVGGAGGVVFAWIFTILNCTQVCYAGDHRRLLLTLLQKP